jgi:hypothetical protein
LNLIRVMPAKGQDTMQKSIYLARLIGPVFAAIGLGMLFNTSHYLAMAREGLHSPVLIYLSGVGLLAAGLAIVLAHNVWVGDWRLIVTLIGWLAVLGGLLRILWPQAVVAIGGAAVAHDGSLIVGGIVVLAIGGVLGYFGYADSVSALMPTRNAPRRPRRKRRTT